MALHDLLATSQKATLMSSTFGVAEKQYHQIILYFIFSFRVVGFAADWQIVAVIITFFVISWYCLMSDVLGTNRRLFSSGKAVIFPNPSFFGPPDPPARGGRFGPELCEGGIRRRKGDRIMIDRYRNALSFVNFWSRHNDFACATIRSGLAICSLWIQNSYKLQVLANSSTLVTPSINNALKDTVLSIHWQN